MPSLEGASLKSESPLEEVEEELDNYGISYETYVEIRVAKSGSIVLCSGGGGGHGSVVVVAVVVMMMGS
ncbi:hypothetical protein Tco_1132710 [Tanacetum coccineum]|uniref:Uncharacterized protein n=1 Tax=Tanacetum coccineum TaxID=301880 RepID=A0ABQ5JCP1_9ASTR